MSAPLHEARIYQVRGRVQGVGFRNFVQVCAAKLGLTGWTRNLDDGRVQVFAQGPPEKLAEFEGLLWKGPRWSEVRGVESSTAAPETCAAFSSVIEHNASADSHTASQGRAIRRSARRNRCQAHPGG